MSPQRTSPAAAARADQPRRAGAPAPPRWLGLAQAGWVVTALLALAVLVASIPGYMLAVSQGDYFNRMVDAPAGLVRALDVAGALASLAAALVCLILAGLLVWRKPDNRMTLFVSFYLLVFGIVMAGPLVRMDALVPSSAALANKVLQPLLFMWPTVALLALFPTGRFVPPWARWLLLLAIPPTLLVLYITDLANAINGRYFPSPGLHGPP